MARINTARPEALAYQGRECKFVRDVVDNEPAYNPNVDQVVVNIDGTDLYFFANEVTLSEGEEKLAAKGREKYDEGLAEQREASKTNWDGKQAMFAASKRGAKPSVEADQAIPGTGGIAGMDIPAHAGSTPQQVAGGVNKFNPVPGSPPQPAEPVTETGKEGLPLGSGSDPQGRRVSAADQSKSNPSERPVPGAQAPQSPPKK